MLPESEYQTIESRQYVNPQVALDESTSFIENLRNTQQQNTAQIAKDTAALGMDVSSNLGGLGGGTDYWTARLSTPQTNALVADLRAINQAKAMNDALATEQAIWKKRYQDAYRKYQKSAYDKANSKSTPDTTTTGGVDETSSDYYGEGEISLDASDIAGGGYYIQDIGTNNMTWVTPEGDNVTLYRQKDGSYSRTKPGANNKSDAKAVSLGGIITGGVGGGVMANGVGGR